MKLVETIESKDARPLPESAAIETCAPKSNKLSHPAPILVRRVQRLDVDEVLARSLPSLGAYSAPEVKTRVSR